MHLEEVKESTLSIFNDKRCYESNIKSLPWNSKKYVFVYVFFSWCCLGLGL